MLIKIKWDEKKFNDVKNMTHDIQHLAWLFQNDMEIDEENLHELLSTIANIQLKLNALDKSIQNIIT